MDALFGACVINLCLQNNCRAAVQSVDTGLNDVKLPM